MRSIRARTKRMVDAISTARVRVLQRLYMTSQARAEDPTAFGAGWYAPVARALRPFDARQTIASVAGLLAVPEYQPVQFRIEMLLHLACSHCRGKKRPSTADLAKWLEVMLTNTPARSMEDSPEDVFVSNVIGPAGNYRISTKWPRQRRSLSSEEWPRTAAAAGGPSPS